MKRSLIKNNFKSISRTRRRFISILVMAFLGVGFYSGLVASSPDMLDSLDRYVDENKMFDISVVSTLGLTDEDLQEINKIEGIECAVAIQTKDSTVQFDGAENVCKVIEYNENINTPYLIYGKMPENSNECLIDEGYFMDDNYEGVIGQKLILDNNDKNEDDSDIFTNKEFTIVGIVESPLYISSERGNTSIGNGSISFYTYVKDDVINMDVYTDIYITVNGAKNEITNSDGYLELVNPVIAKLENIKEQREEARYNNLINEANEKLAEAQKEYDEKKQEAENELLEAEKQINDAKTQITNSEEELNKSEKELKSQESNMQKQFKSAEQQIEQAENELEAKTQELETGKQELEQNRIIANESIQKLNEGIASTKSGIEELEEQKKAMEESGLDTTQIDATIKETTQTLQGLESQKLQIENEIKAAEEKITTGEQQLESGKQELQSQKSKLETSKKTANREISNGKLEIQNGRQELEDAKNEIQTKELEYQDAKKEVEEKLQEAQIELNDAKDEIGKIEKAKWYIQDRLDNTGYTNVFDAIQTMSNISKMFPVIFYLVAVLISLTSMTRMIEEERTEIGTLKSLGYNNFQIISKYVLYAFLACIIGGIIGMSVGFYLLPNIVWTLYSIVYTIPNFYVSYRLEIGLLGILFSFLCIGGATIIVSYNELKELPAILMRPKPPKNGKKIVLERIGFIWKRLKFSEKVTARNIFRYKKRAIMTVVGIAGCTGLMLTGFGIRDSVIDIPDLQFTKVFTYESSISLANTEGLQDLKEYMDANENIENYVETYMATGSLKKDDSKSYDVTMFIPNNNESFDSVCNLVNISNNEKINLGNNGVVITDKVAEFLNVKPGDEITLIDSDDIEYKVKVDAIAENYVSHYVYMSKEFYETNIKSYKTNMLYVNTKNAEEYSSLSEEVLKIDGVTSVTMVSTLLKSISDMLNTMNYIVVVLIISSALLAFVVLYNLANINIGERQREIATLKVLGFYNKEVDDYINKENIVFTVIGVIIGLIFGVVLTNILIASIEIDNLRFTRNIAWTSYVYSSIITILFSLIVNWIIHFILRKIDMIESLKSVE